MSTLLCAGCVRVTVRLWFSERIYVRDGVCADDCARASQNGASLVLHVRVLCVCVRAVVIDSSKQQQQQAAAGSGSRSRSIDLTEPTAYPPPYSPNPPHAQVGFIVMMSMDVGLG